MCELAGAINAMGQLSRELLVLYHIEGNSGGGEFRGHLTYLGLELSMVSPISSLFWRSRGRIGMDTFGQHGVG